MSDLVERLRASVTQARAVDRAALLAEAADEIERLRRQVFSQKNVTLTDAEREALEIAVEYVGSAYAVEHHAKTIQRLLERMQYSDPGGQAPHR